MAQGTDFVLQALVDEGLTHLFLVPGGLVDPFLPALERCPELKPIVAAHEGGAAYMADGYARASGRFGAVLGIGGPGLFNMTTAIATAETDASPVMVLSGEVPTRMEGLGEFQDASQATLDDTAVMKPLTRLSATVVNPATLDHWLRRALTMMWARRGPVHLSLTRDVLTGDCTARHDNVSSYFADTDLLDLPQARAALQTLGENAAPLKLAILAGAGLEDAVTASLLKDTAERWAIPVATTLRAKGAFPEDHDLSLGVFGYAGTRHASIALLGGDLDVLIVLGSGLNERDSMHWMLRERFKGVMIQVNADVTQLTAHGAAAHSVPGSARAFLQLMRQEGETYAAALADAREQRRDWAAKIKSGPRLYDIENTQRATRPIHPATAIAALRKVYPRDGIVLVDSGAHRAFAGHYWSACEPQTYISATNLGPMGWAIPAAVGVQCAKPDRRVAVITGDGCMQMHGVDVQTAARYRLPIIYVVINNAALGNVWLRARRMGELPAELTSVPDHDWAAFARSLGARGVTVENPDDLEDAFAKALAANTTVVIDVKADKDCVTPVYDFSAAKAAWSYHE